VSGAAGSLAKAVVYLLHGTVVALNGLSGAPSRISFTLHLIVGHFIRTRVDMGRELAGRKLASSGRRRAVPSIRMAIVGSRGNGKRVSFRRPRHLLRAPLMTMGEHAGTGRASPTFYVAICSAVSL
jgi:hypothetical protein